MDRGLKRVGGGVLTVERILWGRGRGLEAQACVCMRGGVKIGAESSAEAGDDWVVAHGSNTRLGRRGWFGVPEDGCARGLESLEGVRRFGQTSPQPPCL